MHGLKFPSVLIEKRSVYWKTNRKSLAEDEAKDGGGLSQDGCRDAEAGGGGGSEFEIHWKLKSKGFLTD